MSGQRYNIVDATEDAAKVGYSVGVFATKFFYQVSGAEGLKKSMDSYMVSRFSQKLEYFIYEHEKLTNKQKKDFYDDLTSNKQNLDYLHEFIEKARTSLYDIHAKIYSVLSVKLIKNKGLNYYEELILSNLYILNEDDLKYIAFMLYVTEKHDYYSLGNLGEKRLTLTLIHRNYEYKLFEGSIKLNQVNTFIIDDYEHYLTYKKCIQFGIFDEFPEDDTEAIYESSATKRYLPLDNRKIQSSEFTLLFISILKEVFIETNE